ncbi:zinc ABC transporter substrate-binding protein [Kocuria coralli]|uniref:Zinc ABC transporter substrate-binding protein n=1 Tax=Kocuria coralli TaxID=1461025 RepID=A0A5J5KWX4_9MICC|nr:zinc ABC transporter substrate-binding protein AztC [Kocuria coralli]KAA9393326.1 zinc ABC transporter substrate-binding protein [Kocuria coralli]
MRHGPARRAAPIAAVLTLCLSALLAIAGCGSSQERPSIVVTTNILGDVVQNLVGDNAEVHVLMKPNADPHSFGVSAQEAGYMETADLIVANGLGLEEGLAANLDNARSQDVPVLEVGEHIDPLEYSSGSSSGTEDPHFWTDPGRMIEAVDVIEERLDEELDPGAMDRIRDSASSYRGELEQLDRDVAETLSEVPADRRKLVTNHHVFGYLADRFDYEVVGAVIPSGTTLAAPSAADLNDLSETIRANDVPAIFVDSSQQQKLADVLADEAGVDVEVIPLYSESLTEPEQDAGDYISMQEINAARIADGLTGQRPSD